MIYMDLFLTLVSGTSVALPLGYIAFSLRKTGNDQKLGPNEIRKLENQLPSFLDSISSSLSVGNSLQQSIEAAAQKDMASLGDFFETILLRVRSGMTLDASLELQARELIGGSLSLALLSMASSYRSGSNMIESLSLLATVCRERENLRKKILARTAQSRTQGYVLIMVPVLFMLLLYVVSPHNMIPVLGTTIGRILLATAATLQCLGAIVIRAMLKQEIL
jgi:tight adherence protein B